MKTFVLIISKIFPATHKRKGEETHFPEKILAHLKPSADNVFGWENFKIHTIRANYDLWAKRIKEIQEGKAVLSIRYWSGKPYNTKQIEVFQLDRYSGIGVQKIVIDDIYRFRIEDGALKFGCEGIARNDGLSYDDFIEWFRKYDNIEPMAIIHFTKFRY